MSRVELYSNKTLSIRISTNGFCFCIYEASSPESIEYYEYAIDKNRTFASNLEYAKEKYRFLTSGGFAGISVIYDSIEYTTIPTEQEGDNEPMFYSCFPHLTNEYKIISNRLTAQGITLLFAIEKALYDSLNSLGTVVYYSPMSIIMGYIASQPLPEENYLFAYIHKGRSLLLSIKGGRLQLSNSFDSLEKENHAYYILSLWKESTLSQGNDKLYICGDNSAEEALPLIGKFIRHIERINPTALFRSNLLNKIENIPFDLQALLLCE